VAEMTGKNVEQLMDKINNIPIILDWKGNPIQEWPKIHEAITGCAKYYEQYCNKHECQED
jgi:hypothetical protein